MVSVSSLLVISPLFCSPNYTDIPRPWGNVFLHVVHPNLFDLFCSKHPMVSYLEQVPFGDSLCSLHSLYIPASSHNFNKLVKVDSKRLGC